jgi:hypothetical protein
MGCLVSKKVYKYPKEGLHLYSKEGRMLYTLIYIDNGEYLLMDSISHDVVKLCRIDGTVESQLLVHSRSSIGGKGFCSLFTGEACEKGMCMGNDHIIIDGWVKPGWWISACWFFMFDETHKRLMDNNFLVSAHYLRIELSKMTLTRRHKKMGIEYLVSIGTYDKDGELTVFSEVMYGLR